MAFERKNKVKLTPLVTSVTSWCVGRTLSLLLVISLSICTQLAYSGDFNLVKVGSRYEPELAEKLGVVLPNTSIVAGSYTYVVGSGVEVGRLGFMVGGDKFYYVDSSEYSLSGDVTYGVYGNYFVMDAWGYGSTSGHNRLMFLCQFDKAQIKLLDVINKGYVGSYGMDFMAEIISGKSIVDMPQKNLQLAWMNIQDLDHSGMPEIKLKISGVDFILYIEVADSRLHINFNPVLYTPLFEEEKQKIGSAGKKSNAYYIYGFLAKKLDLNAIRLAVKRDREQHKIIVTLLENVGKWDTAFHDLGDEKFIMKQYDLGRK